MRLLKAVRDHAAKGKWELRFYHAGSSEMYDATKRDHAVLSTQPHAASKVAAHWYAVNYHEAYNLFICDGILFNHEKPCGETSVTRKVTRATTRIKKMLQDKLFLGNLDAKRDWASPATMSKRCGQCSSKHRPTTM